VARRLFLGPQVAARLADVVDHLVDGRQVLVRALWRRLVGHQAAVSTGSSVGGLVARSRGPAVVGRSSLAAGAIVAPQPIRTLAGVIVVLTRHGLTTRSHPEQHLGQRIDVPLSPEGRAQAHALAERLEPVSLARIISSPLRRARETAEIVAARCRPDATEPIALDPRLLEMDYGEWEGLTYEQLDERWRAERDAWEAEPAALPCPGGESGDDVARRVRDLLAELLAGAGAEADAPEAPILLVGHSSTNRILLCVALGIPIRDYRRRIVQGQANLTALEWAAEARVDEAKALLINDLAHVRPPPAAPWE
jgi:probable phosphoglycerate mutase